VVVTKVSKFNFAVDNLAVDDLKDRSSSRNRDKLKDEIRQYVTSPPLPSVRPFLPSFLRPSFPSLLSFLLFVRSFVLPSILSFLPSLIAENGSVTING
jgi:hypothetical protein